MNVLKKLTTSADASQMFDAVTRLTGLDIPSNSYTPLLRAEADCNPKRCEEAEREVNSLVISAIERKYRVSPTQVLRRRSRDDYKVLLLPWTGIDELIFLKFKPGWPHGALQVIVEYGGKHYVNLFLRVLYKLCGNFADLRQDVEINGQTLAQGEWLAAMVFQMLGDSVGAASTIDAALERR